MTHSEDLRGQERNPDAGQDRGQSRAGGLAPRRAALAAITAALGRRGGLEEALAGAEFTALEPRERGFARALAMTALRRRGALDRALGPRMHRPPPLEVMELLRLGAAQLLYMDVASHAAVSTTVDLAVQGKATRPFKALVNAVLRGLQREPPAPLEPEASAPEWLYNRWRAAYGEADAQAIAAMIEREPRADLTLRDPRDADALAAELGAEVLPGGSVRAQHGGEVTEWPGFAEGRWWVQDASAAIPARLVGAAPGETVLDLCAAPGGKTLQLVAAGARVTALDRSEGRLERVRENLARTGLEAEVVAADAVGWSDARQFDAVLLDAPCSATGTFRRHPDVLWGARPSDIGSLAALQARLLASAAGRVKPGGRLVYSVCSLEPEEGEAQVDGFLRAHPEFQLDPIAPGEGGSPVASRTEAGALRILPHHLDGGVDGFFAARVVRLLQPVTKAKSAG